jgi:amidase
MRPWRPCITPLQPLKTPNPRAAPAMPALTSLTLVQMQRLLRARRVSASELLQAHIERIERHDAPIHALVVRDFARARAQAQASDQRLAAGTAGSLEGIPVTIKEAINVQGLPTTVGNPANGDFVSAHDAPTVARLKAAGTVILGKTNVPPEMAD